MIAQFLFVAALQAVPVPSYREAVRCSALLLAEAKFSGQIEVREGAVFNAALLWGQATTAAAKREGVSDERAAEDTKSSYDNALERLRGGEVHISMYVGGCLKRLPQRQP